MDDKTRLRLKRLVAFTILMQSGDGGVLNKVPDYVLSKFDLIMILPEDFVDQPLDHGNKAQFRTYLRKWKVN